jgi:hypothetical protein
MAVTGNITENMQKYMALDKINFVLPEVITKAKGLYTVPYWDEVTTYINVFNTQTGIKYSKIVAQINFRE